MGRKVDGSPRLLTGSAVHRKEVASRQQTGRRSRDQELSFNSTFMSGGQLPRYTGMLLRELGTRKVSLTGVTGVGMSGRVPLAALMATGDAE